MHIKNVHSSKQKNEEQSTSGTKSVLKLKRSDAKTEFICRICSTKYEERIYLNRHITTSHVSIVFKCYRCNVSFDKTYNLYKHLKHAHSTFSKEKGFIDSIMAPANFGSFHCCFCRFSSKGRVKVEEHLMDEHYDDFETNGNADESLASSPDSLEELLLPETRAKLNRNLNREEDGDDDDEEDLLTEMVSKNQQYDNNRRKPPNHPSFKYRCVRCLRRFSRSSWLKRHICIALSETPTLSPPVPKKPRISNEVNGFFKCTKKTCSQVFTDRKRYNEHLEQHHN